MKNGIIAADKMKSVTQVMARGLIASFFWVFVMACSGCGGGGENVGMPVEQAQPKAVTIDAEGDSTMYGTEIINGVTVRSADPAPSVAQQSLTSSTRAPVTIENNGSPGTTAYQNLTGHVLAPLATRLASDPAQIVIENFGINDSGVTTVSAFHDELTNWILTVRGMGKIPVLEEPNPVTRADYDALPSFVQMINQVATEQGVQVIQQYAYIQSLPNWQGMLTDGVHPGDALYQIKGQREAAILAPLVTKLSSQ